MVVYLQNGLVADQIVPLADYYKFDPVMQLKSCMEIDSQAINHLELLEVQGMTKIKKEGSLFHYLDHTRTAFGKRLLKKWIVTPLYDIPKINSRLDAVEDMMTYYDLTQRF